jgi:eukaryotic-like serine/threonine-protein kinase
MSAVLSEVKSLFGKALEIASPQERAAFLEAECGENAALRSEVQELLAALDKAGDFLKQPGGATTDYRPAEGPGTRVGQYKLLQQIGEGGFGIVFMAEQEQHVRRKVALKVIKPGMDTKQVIARFEAERQALAVMDHPSIAKVFDGGETVSGRPFFVMELVHGVPITKYCDDNHLTARERLELFIPVCQAVQHAHQKGIIHRDLKPTNILVTLYDSKPVPKVIDFGVAKATEQRLTETTMFTNFGTVVGTFEYMSPEQAEMNALGVDTRSDVYSLGVLLYELLTGTTPLERKRVREAAFAEVLRLIREEEPPKPSTRLNASKETLPAMAALRNTDPRKLAHEVRGDLDWIVMKCLEKDRTRRYDAASGLAKDLERHLRDDAVEACPPSAGYRLRKWMWRNRVATLVALIIWAWTLIFIGFGTLNWMMACDERDRAVQAERQAAAALTVAQDARDRATQSRQQAEENALKAKEAEDKARAVANFLQNDILAQADSGHQANRRQEVKPDLTVREALDRAAANLGRFGPGQELTEANLRLAIGEAYIGIGDARRAVPHLERSRDIHVAKLGPHHKSTLNALLGLGKGYYSAGRLPEARQVLQELHAVAETRLGKEHSLTIAGMTHLALTLLDTDRRAEAVPLLEEALRRARKALGPDHGDTLHIMNNLGAACERVGRWEDALALYEETLRLRRIKDGPTHPDTLVTMHNLGTVLRRLGRVDRSIPLKEEVFKQRVVLLGPAHPLTVRTQADLGINYQEAGRVREAIPVLEDALRRARPFAGAEEVNLRGIMEALAETYTLAGEHAKAETLFRELLAEARKGPDTARRNAASWQARLGLNLLQQKKLDEAETLVRDALAVRQEKEPDDWRTFNTLSILGGILLERKKYAEAEPLLRQGHEGMRQRRDKMPKGGGVRYHESLERLARLCEETGKKEEAAKWRQEWEAAKQKTPDKS